MNEKNTLIPGYTHILHGGDYNPDQWLETPEIIQEDFRLMKLAGCNTFSVGIFSWTTYEKEEGKYNFDWLDDIMNRMAKAGNKVLLATPSGSKPAWMAEKYPEIRRVSEQGLRDPQQRRHNHCWTSPVYREKVTQINTRLAERYANHPALGGWHISNEYGGACYCELCQEAYRKFLKEKYQTLENLNRAWYTAFWNVNLTSWSQVTPFVTSDAQKLDWRRFMTAQCRSFIQTEIAPLRRLTPALPVTTNMMGFFYDFDYFQLAKDLDFVSDDVYPSWDFAEQCAEVASDVAMRHDMLRAMKNRPFLIMESCPSATNWQRYGRLKRPAVHKFQELLALAHGADGTMYFQWRKARGNAEKTHGSVVDHVGHENTRVFRDVAELGQLYDKCTDLPGAKLPVEAALVYDWESRWAFDATNGPSAAPYKKYHETAHLHYRTFWEKNIPLDVISPEFDFSKYKLLVVPMLFLVRKETAGKLKDFVKNGGTLVATYFTGYVDEDNAFHLGGLPGAGLQELFGIWNEEIDGLTEKDVLTLEYRGKTHRVLDYAELLHPADANVLASYQNQFYAGMPALTCREFGKGKAYYIAARTGEGFLADFYDSVLRETGIKPVIEPAWQKIHATRRIQPDGEFLFVSNYDMENPQQVTLPDGIYRNKADGAEKTGTLTLRPMESLILKKQS